MRCSYLSALTPSAQSRPFKQPLSYCAQAGRTPRASRSAARASSQVFPECKHAYISQLHLRTPFTHAQSLAQALAGAGPATDQPTTSRADSSTAQVSIRSALMNYTHVAVIQRRHVLAGGRSYRAASRSTLIPATDARITGNTFAQNASLPRPLLLQQHACIHRPGHPLRRRWVPSAIAADTSARAA
jgi:hypothetical protein